MEQTATKMNLNPLPALTWNRLRMNHTPVTLPEVTGKAAMTIELPEEFRLETKGRDLCQGLPVGGLGEDFNKYLDRADLPVQWITAPAETTGEPVVIRLAYAAGASQGAVFAFQAQANSQLTVIEDCTGHGKGEASLVALQTFVEAGENAQVHLVQIRRMEQGFTCLNDLAAVCGPGAKLTLTQLVLGEGETYQGCRIALEGERSAAEIDLAYLLSQGGRLDMNYNIIHCGQKTESRLNAAGVLKSGARKLFRGTIDFRKGSSGAVGAEEEDVLLLDDDVVNQTIPLILCAEEDVQGSHGATIGKLSQEILYYMTARGLPQEKIYDLLAHGRVQRVSRRIPQKALREEIDAYLEGGEEND